jgi:hypothetical protein
MRVRLARSFIAVAAAPLALFSAGCDRSCARLAEQLCEQASMSNAKNADEICETWRTRVSRVSPTTCQGALRRLGQQR